MHDPFQTYQATQYGSPYMGLQNPLATLNPFAGYAQHAGIPGYGGIHPQLQLQLAALASQGGGQQWSPYAGLQNPFQNPFLTSILQNPYALQSLQAAGLLQNPMQNPLLQNPLFAQSGGFGGSPFGQQQTPFQQFGQQQHSPFQQFGQYGQYGQGLAPQSWIGQGAQFGGRPFHTPGISPWGF